MVAYLKASPQEKTYSDYLQATREAEKEDSMELSQSPWNQTTNNTAKPRMTSFFSLQKLKGAQLALKTPAVHLAHLEEESVKKDEEVESKDPDGIDGVTEKFMVHLVRAVKDAQVEEKHCYHCSSLEHFIHDCPLVRARRVNMQLNYKEGMVLKKGVWAPQIKVTMPQNPQGVGQCTQDSLLESWPLSVLVWGCQSRQSEDQWRELYGPPQQWHANKCHHAQLCEESLTAGGADYQPDQWKSCLHRSGKCLHLTPRVCYCQGSSGWSPGL